MSTEWKGRYEGRKDGQNDAQLGRPKRPRPKLMLSVKSTRYRDAYLVAYAQGYRDIENANERRIAEHLRASSRLAVNSRIPKNNAFERGWRDGFAGKDAPPEDLSHEALIAYERGHKQGQQQLDFERSRNLMQNTRRQNFQNRQGKSR